MSEFLAPLNYGRARDVLRRLSGYSAYTPQGAAQALGVLRESYPLVFDKLESKQDVYKRQVRARVTELMGHCSGASRTGANGARAKLAFAMRAVEHGTNVIIGHARYHITDLLAGRVPCTRLGVNVEKQA